VLMCKPQYIKYLWIIDAVIDFNELPILRHLGDYRHHWYAHI